MSPAVKGMKQAHGLFLIIRRAALHYGAYQHLQKPAPQRIDGNRNQKSRISVRQNLRQYRKP